MNPFQSQLHAQQARLLKALASPARLSAAGFDVLHLRGGVAEWLQQQRPLVASA
jgi:rhodanese-related sulfurtransferase